MSTSSSLQPYRRPFFYRRVQAACWVAEKLGATVPLNRATLEQKALAITGRTGFLGSSFREPLEILLRSLLTDARLNAVGRHGAALTLTRQLVTRLCMEEAWGAAVRRQCGIRTAETTNRLAPYLTSIHAADPIGPEECHWLTMATLVTHAFPMQWRVKSYTDWLDERTEGDWERAYAEYLSLLGLLDGGMTDRHWVLKCPLHAPRLATLAKLVPDAIFVQTYRDIREVAGSLCSLTMAMRSVTSDTWDPVADGHDVAAALARDTCAAVRAAEQHQERVIHVHYTSLVRDPINAIRGIYARAGMSWSAVAETAMQQWLAENTQGRHGRHRYSLADFAISESSLLESCLEYVATERRL